MAIETPRMPMCKPVNSVSRSSLFCHLGAFRRVALFASIFLCDTFVIIGVKIRITIHVVVALLLCCFTYVPAACPLPIYLHQAERIAQPFSFSRSRKSQARKSQVAHRQQHHRHQAPRTAPTIHSSCRQQQVWCWLCGVVCVSRRRLVFVPPLVSWSMVVS